MIFFKIFTFYDVSNLQKPSWIKGQIACHCNIILYTLFRIKFFQLTHLFYVTVLFYLFTELSYPSHLCLAVLKPIALVVNLCTDYTLVFFTLSIVTDDGALYDTKTIMLVLF